MSSDKTESLADLWASRYDDRDAQDLVAERWAHRMGLRDQAIAQPFRNFTMPDEAQADSEPYASLPGEPLPK